MALATRSVVCTIMGERQLGSTWKKMMYRSDLPKARAASTYSWLRTVKTAARVVRTNPGMDDTPTAIMRLIVLLPNTETTTTAIKIAGTAEKMPVTRIITVSVSLL